jgi:hypothetical protein
MKVRTRWLSLGVPLLLSSGRPGRSSLLSHRTGSGAVFEFSNDLVLTLHSVNEKAFDTIRKMGFEPLQNNHEDMKVKVVHMDDVRKILSTIKDAGASLHNLDVRKPDLEEVFLKRTGEALCKDPAGKVAQ